MVRKLVAAAGAAPLALGTPLPAQASPDEVGGWSLGDRAAANRLPNAMRPFVSRNMDEVEGYHFTVVRHGDYLRPLPEGSSIDVTAQVNGRSETIASFMERYRSAALIVVKDGTVRFERYRYGNTRHSKWDMQSVTKSLVSTAMAAALHEGRIGSFDEQVTAWLPELAGSAYDGVTLQHLLDMTSGIDREDVYDGSSPRINAGYAAQDSTDPEAITAYLRSLPREAAPGTRFAYDSFDPFVLGEVLRRATGMPVARYISERIWSPAGMEEDAYLSTTVLGKEKSNGGLSATLRDMARFGLFALEGGAANGRQVVPPAWFPAIAGGVTDPANPRHPGNIAGRDGAGYRDLWWLPPKGRDGGYELGDDGGFYALGAFGQQLYVVPGQNLVVVIQSADLQPSPSVAPEGRALATAIARHYREGR
jgi:CubicO group peptidase (beta-lactamase class C family)